MSIEKFPEIGRFKVSDTAESVFAGGFTLDEAIQLEQLICHIYKHGTAGGSETLKANIYVDAAMTKLLCQSDPYVLEDAAMGTHWRGRIPLTFNKEFLDSGKVYYVAFELTNYTRNGDTYYISYLLDNYNPINDLTGDDYALYCAFIGYKKREGEQ
jgi:hypothetical protein